MLATQLDPMELIFVLMIGAHCVSSMSRQFSMLTSTRISCRLNPTTFCATLLDHFFWRTTLLDFTYRSYAVWSSLYQIIRKFQVGNIYFFHSRRCKKKFATCVCVSFLFQRSSPAHTHALTHAKHRGMSSRHMLLVCRIEKL
jgi:hypothetical protein